MMVSDGGLFTGSTMVQDSSGWCVDVAGFIILI